MDRILADHPYLAWIVAAAAVVTALGVLWRKVVRPALRWTRRTARRVDATLDGLLGVPAKDDQPAKPGIIERMGRVEQRLASIEHELHPNSGTSLRDAVDRVEQKVTPPAE